MAKIILLLLVDPKCDAFQLWNDSTRDHPTVRSIAADNLAEIRNHPDFLNISAVVYHGFSVPQETFRTICQSLPKLRWIHLCTTGVDRSIEFLRGLPPNVIVTNARGAYSSILAEYVMAAVLHFNKQIPRLQENKKNQNYENFRMSRLEGKTLGILGFGNIGAAIARIARNGFKMRVIAAKRQSHQSNEQSNEQLIDELIIPKCEDSRLRIFRNSDYLVNVLPSTSATRHYCSSLEFGCMKSSAIFINIGRGHTVDETALVSALRNRQIGGAALDVFEEEPLRCDHDLWKLDNVLISAHNADYTDDIDEMSIRKFVENLKRFEAGAQTSEEMISPVDLVNGY